MTNVFLDATTKKEIADYVSVGPLLQQVTSGRLREDLAELCEALKAVLAGHYGPALAIDAKVYGPGHTQEEAVHNLAGYALTLTEKVEPQPASRTVPRESLIVLCEVSTDDAS